MTKYVSDCYTVFAPVCFDLTSYVSRRHDTRRSIMCKCVQTFMVEEEWGGDRESRAKGRGRVRDIGRVRARGKVMDSGTARDRVKVRESEW